MAFGSDKQQLPSTLHINNPIVVIAVLRCGTLKLVE